MPFTLQQYPLKADTCKICIAQGQGGGFRRQAAHRGSCDHCASPDNKLAARGLQKMSVSKSMSGDTAFRWRDESIFKAPVRIGCNGSAQPFQGWLYRWNYFPG